MKLFPYLAIFLLGLACCNANKNSEVEKNSTKSKSVEFPNFNAQFSNKVTLNVVDEVDRIFELDSIQYSNWADKVVPYKSDDGRLYTAQLYSVQPQLENFAVIALKVRADNWFKLHLITINKDLELIDQIAISNSWSDLLEQAGDVEVVGKQLMYTKMMSENKYQSFDIRTTEIINYYSDTTTYEIDSVTTEVNLLRDGTFELNNLDSVRLIKYSSIE